MRHALGMVFVVWVCGLLGAGCSWFGGGDDENMGVTTEPLEEFGPIGDDIPLQPRFDAADGRRTEAEFQVEPVHFAYDSFQVQPGELTKVERAADIMRRNPTVDLVTEGHCDERGSREYNMALGEHRALAIRANLTTLGIDGGRIQTRSYGEEKPVDPGHTEDAWRLNRRVEFVFY